MGSLESMFIDVFQGLQTLANRMCACTLWLQYRSHTIKYNREQQSNMVLSAAIGKCPSYKMIIVRWITILPILGQSNLILYGPILWIFESF